MRLAAILPAILLAACAGASSGRLSETVDDSLVAMLPPEGRLWTYEAENEVIIALDRHDQARAEAAAAEARVARAEEAEEVAGKRGKGESVAKARVEWREKQLEHARADVDATAAAIGCARANLELTKARLAIRFDLPIDDVDFVTRYEKQYDDCAADLDKVRAEAEQAKVAAGKAREQWRKVRSEFVAKSGDHDHGLWID